MRGIDLVLLRKGLKLFRFAQDHQYITGNGTFDTLIQSAVDDIVDTKLDDQFFKVMNITPSDLENIGIANAFDAGLTWMEVAVLLVDGMTLDECKAVLSDVFAYHTRVSMTMSTHLQLTAENVGRSTWWSAEILSKDPEQARAGARKFHDHIIRLRPGII